MKKGKGNLTENRPYSPVAQKFSVHAADVIKRSFEAAQNTLRGSSKILDEHSS